MTSLSGWLEQSTKRLRDKGIDTARLDCLLLLEHVLGKKRANILAHAEEQLTTQQNKKLSKLLKLRSERTPMAYITKHKQFYRYDFYVDERVLIPRSTSEPIVDWCIDNAPNGASCIDLGTGSGCLAISLKLMRPDLRIIATDVSEEAVQVARENAKSLNADVEFAVNDLLLGLDDYDIYIANLPYVPISYNVSPEVHQEPKVAIYSEPDGLQHYRRLAKQLSSRDTIESKLIIEHNPEQFEQLKQIFSAVYEHPLSVSNYTTLFTN